MKNRPFKHITHLLYCFLLSLPVISILGRVIYTQSNPNAMDNYSDSYVSQLTLVNNSDYVISGANYMISYNANNSNLGNQSYNPIQTNLTDYITLQEGQSIKTFVIMIDGVRPRIQIILNDDTTTRIMDWQNVCPVFYFTLSSSSSQYFNTSYASLYLITETTNKLDNAFDYSVSKFIQNNNLGNVDLFSWFGDIFLDTQNETNKLYLDFINWYLNYTLLVSSSYLIFMVLYWFTAYVRKIMDKSMNQDFGGF